jgi:hypothetical protein
MGVEQYRLYLVTGPIVELYLYRIDDASCAALSA